MCSNYFLNIIEEELLKTMENGKYAEMSSSVSTKYNAYVKQFFPMLDKIGVKSKVLSKAQMKAYIAKNS